jgi:hypothetical protein
MPLTQVQGQMLSGSNNTTTTIQSNGTTAITIDSSQNVGIGTSSPGQKLEVYNANGGAILRVTSSATGTGSGNGFHIGLDGDGLAYLVQNENQALLFSTNATERMRINSNGNVRIGLSSGGTERLHVEQPTIGAWTEINSNSSASGQGLCHLVQFTVRAPNDTTSLFYYAGDTLSARFIVYSNGGVANFQGNNANLSDRREKTNFSTAPSYLEKICAIPVQTFNYIDQNLEDDDGLTLGVTAQDVQAVAPELVMESNWGTKDEPKMRLSIYQTDLQYALMKSIQELKAELDEAKAEIAALKEAK